MLGTHETSIKLPQGLRKITVETADLQKLKRLAMKLHERWMEEAKH
jgi:hypothetical protein